ncbi:VWA domain-containing protein [Tessaracoccus sp. SD287]|uniref:VWA domain-containing protein n=1 Tax=Tessaracoccus sp. SD287 TaxID=2782008 RepID=UPI001F61ADED|nr:VWA domain-containing protein [Tessaracoccus sp. SD287]
MVNVAMITWPEFQSPDRLWVLALVPLLIIAYLIALRLRSKSGMRFTNTGILGKVLPKQSSWRRHVAVAMTICSLLALSLAWARPMGIDKVPRERATIVLVIDVSLSMKATDVAPNRLDAAKKAAIEFVGTLPDSYNVAVVALSGNPQVRMPPSVDRGAIQRAIETLDYQDSTAIGDGIQAALNALKMAPTGEGETPAPGAIVMLSDGQNTTGQSPGQMAEKAKQAKIKIYTIAYGTQTGWVDIDGKRERVAPDVELLKNIATQTDGKAWTADSAKELSQVYKDVRGEVGYEEVRVEITAQWAFYALAFAVVAALGAVSMAARWPS